MSSASRTLYDAAQYDTRVAADLSQSRELRDSRFYDAAQYDTSKAALEFEDTELYARHNRHVRRGDPNDFIIVITASSHTPVSGSGKTTAAQSLCKQFDITEEMGTADGYSAEANATLRPKELAYDLMPNAPAGSALNLEEAQGTPESSGLDARRGMKESIIKTINAILANRDQRTTIVIVAQQLSMLDSRLYPLIDAWLLIRKAPMDPGGPLMTHHKLIVDDYDLKNPKLKTPALEDLRWPRIPHGDPDYKEMERMKQVAKKRQQDQAEEESEDDGLTKEAQKWRAQALRDSGDSLEAIADDHMIEFSREWVRQNTVANSQDENA
jgi:hypothetical protein